MKNFLKKFVLVSGVSLISFFALADESETAVLDDKGCAKIAVKASNNVILYNMAANDLQLAISMVSVLKAQSQILLFNANLEKELGNTTDAEKLIDQGSEIERRIQIAKTKAVEAQSKMNDLTLENTTYDRIYTASCDHIVVEDDNIFMGMGCNGELDDTILCRIFRRANGHMGM